MRTTRSDASRRTSGARRAALSGVNGSRRRPAIAVSDARGVRTLHVGGEAIQSAMRIAEPEALALDYTRCMMAFLLFHSAPRQALQRLERAFRGALLSVPAPFGPDP